MMGPPLRTVITGPGTGVDPETTSRQVRAMMCGFQEVVPTWLKLKGTVFIVLRVRCIFHKMRALRNRKYTCLSSISESRNLRVPTSGAGMEHNKRWELAHTSAIMRTAT